MGELAGLKRAELCAENTKLKNESRYQQQVINHLSNSLDQEMKRKDNARSIFKELDTGKMTDGTALSYIRMILLDGH